LKADGTVVSWGITNGDGGVYDYGQSHAPTNITNAIAIAVGADHNLALLRDGTVTGWGSDDFDQLFGPRQVTGVAAVTAGGTTSFLLLTNGTVLSFGRSDKGRVPPVGLSNVVAVSSYEFTQIALKADGTVTTWGSLVTGPQPAVSNVVAVAAGGGEARVLFADNSIGRWSWDTNLITNDLPAGVANISGIAEGEQFSVAWTGDEPYRPFAAPSLFRFTGGNFSMTVNSVRGMLYRMESTDSLSPANWTLYRPVPGNGDPFTLVDLYANVPARFYRIRQQ
jgi:alpha-tubulin suppressor-like RCC1 family protein